MKCLAKKLIFYIYFPNNLIVQSLKQHKLGYVVVGHMVMWGDGQLIINDTKTWNQKWKIFRIGLRDFNCVFMHAHVILIWMNLGLHLSLGCTQVLVYHIHNSYNIRKCKVSWHNRYRHLISLNCIESSNFKYFNLV